MSRGEMIIPTFEKGIQAGKSRMPSVSPENADKPHTHKKRKYKRGANDFQDSFYAKDL